MLKNARPKNARNVMKRKGRPKCKNWYALRWWQKKRSKKLILPILRDLKVMRAIPTVLIDRLEVDKINFIYHHQKWMQPSKIMYRKRHWAIPPSKISRTDITSRKSRAITVKKPSATELKEKKIYPPKIDLLHFGRAKAELKGENTGQQRAYNLLLNDKCDVPVFFALKELYSITLKSMDENIIGIIEENHYLVRRSCEHQPHTIIRDEA